MVFDVLGSLGLRVGIARRKVMFLCCFVFFVFGGPVGGLGGPGVVLEQVEAVAKPLLVPVQQKKQDHRKQHKNE